MKHLNDLQIKPPERHKAIRVISDTRHGEMREHADRLVTDAAAATYAERYELLAIICLRFPAGRLLGLLPPLCSKKVLVRRHRDDGC